MSVSLGSWRAPVVLAYVAFVFVGINAGVGTVLLPAQIDDYHVDMATIGLTFFTFSAGFFLAGATSGALMHRFGTRLTLVAAGGVFVVAALAAAARPLFWVYVAMQILAGYAIGVLETVLNAYLATLPAATTLINRLHGFFGVGALVGPPFAAWVLHDLGRQWTMVWLLLALAGVALTVAFLLVYPRTNGAAGTTTTGRQRLLGPVLRSPAVLLAASFLGVYVGLELGVGNWGFTYAVGEHAVGDLAAGWIISGYWLGLTVGRFVISPLATRLGWTSARMMFACLFGVIISSLLVWVAPVAAAAGIGFVALGFFLGPLFPTAIAVMPEVTEERLVPTAIGILNGMSLVGGAALPWVAGAIAQGVGLWTLMPYALALGVVQLVIWWLLVARMREPVPQAVVTARE
ncbi:sugar MFS transporter [Luedemannella flava]|uniref:Sugar MFS transporter n=1 Tax=Luedemannella flava TaxID=349316 RepID=A0ABP4YE62_9ACTN